MYIENESLVGTKDGSNKSFTTVSNALEIDRVSLANTGIIDYEFTSPNSIVLNVAPGALETLTADYWTTGSLVGNERPSDLESILFRVRTMLGEHYSEQWIDRSITDWLNEAINKICVKHDFPFMEAQATIYTTDGKESYQLPAGFKKVIGVFSESSELSLSDSRENIGSGYTLFDDTIILPRPSSGASVRIRYYRYLPYFDWQDTATTCKVPRQYEQLLIDWAVCRAKQSEEIYDVARIHEDAFERGLNAMILDLGRRVEAEYPSIRPMKNMY